MATVIDSTHNGPNPVLIRDILQPMTDVELKTMWEEDIKASSDFALRDSLLEVMLQRGVRPDTWIHRRDAEYGLYPDADDPDFASRLIRKTEFAQLRSVASDEDTCAKSRTQFDTTPVQRLVSRFMNPMTPYLGLLLDHGVGVGKTCSAVTVAETFLEVSPYNTVYILAPQAIADGFRKTIFDVSKLTPATAEEMAITGEAWKSSQCTGMTYPRLVEMAETKEDIAKEAEKLIKKRYKIVGYLAFANWVKSKLDTIPAVITGVARKDKEKQILMSLFSDHLMIIDEAHNLRDMDAAEEDETSAGKATDAAEGKRLTPILKSILAVAEGMRLMLMTATPMYNTAPEILFLLNLLILNDTKDESKLLKQRDIFKPDGQFADTGEALLTTNVRRYVSYMRGENPNTFPLRLTPPEHAGRAFMEAYPILSISRKEDEVQLSEMDKQIMERLPLIVHEADETVAGKKILEILGQHRGTSEEGGAVEVSDFILDQTMQAGNITYPDGSFGTRGWEINMKSETNTVGTHKVKQLVWTNRDTTIESVFGLAGIQQHAPKISAIVESITAAKGMQFVYSRYVLAGALPICVALELQGWSRVLADGTPAPLLKRASGKPKHYYILLTSDDSLSPNFKGLLNYATTFDNPDQALNGTKVKAIIGSQVASEGLDLKCIREIHLLDGWYHLNRTEQIIGRGVRFCSHVLLPPEERNTLIYLHAVSVAEYETADLYAYRLAVRKAQPIGRVSRLMKINAWDCMLNKEAILLADMPPRAVTDAQGRSEAAYDVKDKPFTSFCDFSEDCEYVCGSRSVAAANVGMNKSTYTESDFRRLFLEKQERLQDLFSDETAFLLKTIRELVYGDMPWSIGAIGLREALGKLKIKRTDGIYGTLVLLNNYVVFQPEGVTDTQIPLAFRYGRAYGRLPRTIIPQRSRLLETDIPMVDKEAERIEVVSDATTDALRADALKSLHDWHALLRRMIAEPSGKIDPPLGFSKESFNGWRWLFHHFATLPETVPIACCWWMDNVWTWKQREAVFRDWSTRGLASLKDDEAMYASVFQPRELFHGALSGYLVYDTEKLA